MFQRQELESENKKLKHNLAEIRQSLLRDTSAGAGAPGSPPYKVLLEQLTASCEELEVRKEEVLILRSQLVSQKEAMQHKVEDEFRSCFHPHVCEHLGTVVTCCRREAGYKCSACIHLLTSVCFVFARVVILFVCAQFPKSSETKQNFASTKIRII